jgi:hypothetical protein
MKLRRPSPSMIVSVVALVVATAGTATAAGVLISNSSQVKAGAINGSDIKNRSITGIDIADKAISDRQLSASVKSKFTSQGFVATEAVRKSGPLAQPAGQHVVATLAQLQPGTYVLAAKTILAPTTGDQGLLTEVLKQPKTAGGHCVMSAGGDVDDSRAPIATPYSDTPTTLHMQMTRTLGAPTDIVLTCDAGVPWQATDTSIIALKLTGSSRTDVTG